MLHQPAQTRVSSSPRRVERHARIDSTNDRARALLRERDGAGVLVVADEQTAGRGRRGRTWASPPGRNLYLSAGFRPRLSAGDAWQLSFAAALAVREACIALAELCVKWPNDLVDRDGAKVAGLLIETSIEGDRLGEAIVGIGINVNWRRSEMPGALRARATSLAELVGTDVDREALLRSLADALDAELGRVEAGVSPLDRYRRVSWLTGRRVEVDAGAEMIGGRAVGIGDDGALRVEAPGGEVPVAHGEVVRVHLEPGSPA